MVSSSLLFNFLWFSVMVSCSKRSPCEEGGDPHLPASIMLPVAYSLLQRDGSNRESLELELELHLWICRLLWAVGDEGLMVFKSEGGEKTRKRKMWTVCEFAEVMCESRRIALGPEAPVLMSVYYLLIETHTNIWNKNKINIGFKDITGMALKAFIKCKLNCDQSELIFFLLNK